MGCDSSCGTSGSAPGCGVVPGGARKHPQFFTDEIVERGLHSEASFDRS
jgi:hypothetical protein